MAAKLNLSAIEDYAKRYAEKLCDEFFARNTTINGQQVLNLSNIGQVNMFVVAELFDKWKRDTEQFKSPFFNFGNDAVKEALQGFMNTVSQNISIKREDFEPLLTGATQKTLGLLLDPEQHFDGLIRDMPDFQLTASDLKQITKYTRIHKGIPQSISERMAGQESVYVSQALSWLSESIENGTLEDTDKYWEQFSSKIPVGKDDFIKKPEYIAPPAPAVVEETGNKMSMTTSFFDFDDEDDKETPLPTVESIKKTVAEVAPAEVPTPTPVPTHELTLNDNFSNELPTVNDILKRETSTETYAEYFQNKMPVASIADAVSLHQKFTFIAKLFDGDLNSYNAAIAELDQCLTFGEAKNIMNRKLAPKFNWIMAAEEADEFLDLVNRKFA
jgi:hypothetical protein